MLKIIHVERGLGKFIIGGHILWGRSYRVSFDQEGDACDHGRTTNGHSSLP